MSGSDEDMSANSNVSSEIANSCSPPSQIVPQLTMPSIIKDVSLHGMVSVLFISMVTL